MPENAHECPGTLPVSAALQNTSCGRLRAKRSRAEDRRISLTQSQSEASDHSSGLHAIMTSSSEVTAARCFASGPSPSNFMKGMATCKLLQNPLTSKTASAAVYGSSRSSRLLCPEARASVCNPLIMQESARVVEQMWFGYGGEQVDGEVQTPNKLDKDVPVGGRVANISQAACHQWLL